MGSHPLNLTLRFLLELGAIAAMGYWGWTQHEGLARWLWTIGAPLIAAVLWGIFAVPNDPSRSGHAPVPTPGALRLLLELLIFAAGAIAFIASQQESAGIILAATVLFHYAISYNRILWLFKH
jgi:hypothetical protein